MGWGRRHARAVSKLLCAAHKRLQPETDRGVTRAMLHLDASRYLQQRFALRRVPSRWHHARQRLAVVATAGGLRWRPCARARSGRGARALACQGTTPEERNLKTRRGSRVPRVHDRLGRRDLCLSMRALCLRRVRRQAAGARLLLLPHVPRASGWHVHGPGRCGGHGACAARCAERPGLPFAVALHGSGGGAQRECLRTWCF